MITPEERREAERIFRESGFDGPLTIAPILSEDERVFVLPAGASLAGRRGIERALQAALRRKIWIVERSESWPNAEPLH